MVVPPSEVKLSLWYSVNGQLMVSNFLTIIVLLELLDLGLSNETYLRHINDMCLRH